MALQVSLGTLGAAYVSRFLCGRMSQIFGYSNANCELSLIKVVQVEFSKLI